MENKQVSVAVQNHEVAQWELLQRQCDAFIKSGFLPKHVHTLAQAITIAWKGRELGIPPLQAFSSITVINGKPCLAAELMLALIYSRCPGAKVKFITPKEKRNAECTATFQRPGGEPQEFTFDINDAKTAGIYKNAWLTYPSALLRARVISAGARAVFPDCIMGCYTPEELGGEPLEGELVEVATYSEPHIKPATAIKLEETADTTNKRSNAALIEAKAPTKAETEKGLAKGTVASKNDLTRLASEIRKSNWSDDDVYEYLKMISDKDKPVMELKDLSWFQCQAMLTRVKALRKGVHAQ